MTARPMRPLLLAPPLALIARPALGHALGAHDHAAGGLPWNPDPLALAPILAVALGYGFGLARLWRRAGVGRGITVGRAAAFVLGTLALLAALVSPLDAAAEASFAAHMAQHMVLIAVAPPLLVLGNTLVALTMALPAPSRRPVGRGLLSGPPGKLLGALAAVPVATALHGAAVWIWHAPVPYEAALRNELVHDAEHLTVLGTAVLFWWSVIHAGRRRPLGHGAGIAGLLLTTMHTGLLGALITFAPAPLYPTYAAAATGIGGLSVLEDQQLAGVIMLLPCAAVYLVAGLTLLATWLATAGRSRPGAGAAVRSTAAAAAAADPTAGHERRPLEPSRPVPS